MNIMYLMASLVAQMVKNPAMKDSCSDSCNAPAMQKTWVQSLGWEEPLEEGVATHSNILVWRIPMDKGAWRAPSIGLQRVRHNWVTKHTMAVANVYFYFRPFDGVRLPQSLKKLLLLLEP